MAVVAGRLAPTQRDHQDDSNDTYSCGTGASTVKVSNRGYRSPTGTLIWRRLARRFCLENDDSLPDQFELDWTISEFSHVEDTDEKVEWNGVQRTLKSTGRRLGDTRRDSGWCG
jgi:hypothetical protein